MIRCVVFTITTDAYVDS